MPQKESEKIEIAEMLKDGWSIAGYSVDVLHSGLFCHSILLQKDIELKAVTITTGKGEVGRSIAQLAPTPEKKKGIFG